ncbi:coproporphyrinogen III oxidase, partial [Lysobacter sp. N42]
MIEIKRVRRPARTVAPMATHTLPERSVLERYSQPGPRYTSYPTAPQFDAAFGDADLRAAIASSNGDPIPRPLSLYVHVPFCHSPCFYCGCNRVITRDRSRSAHYLQCLRTEIGRVAPLFDADREVRQLHFGGGTPNFLSPAQLADVVRELERRFRFSPSDDRDISIELDPRFVEPEDIARLAALGF